MFSARAAEGKADSYEALVWRQDGALVAVQPAPGGAAAAGGSVDTLLVDLGGGRVEAIAQPAMGASGAAQALALAGVFRFKAGTVLVLVTAAEQVAVLHGLPVMRVTATQVVKPPGARFDAGEARLLALLEQAVSPTGAGRGVYYSPGGDLTLCAQARAQALADPLLTGQPLCARADRRFWWNRVLAAPLVEAGATSFVTTMMLGFVEQLAGMPVRGAGGKSHSMDVTLIARRSLDRCGTRHWRRGADAQGAVANFVESEQLVALDGGRLLSSFVQLRGSIPLLWTQLPNIKYKPPTKIRGGAPSSAAFDAHAADLVDRYGAVTAINLVNQHGSEGLLAAQFEAEARRYKADEGAPLTYVAFDFHKECGATNYGRMSVLFDAVSAQFEAGGSFLQEAGVVATRQAGVMRINCIDCLDRTNVVQAMLARKALEALLRQPSLGVLGPGQALADLAEVEARYKVMWADHGDAISMQYAGTGALKSGFTRTGKRTLGGLVDDGVKSIGRYYLNNFQDGAKQDALDLLSGAYTLKPGVRVTFTPNHSPLVPLLAAGLCFVLAARALGQLGRGELLAEGEDGAALGRAVLLRVVAPLLAAAGIVMLVQRYGRQLVKRPQLLPSAANTLAAAAPPDK